VQVILTGKPIYYNLLHYYDEDFKELFKVKADFDTSMDANAENMEEFSTFISFVNQQEKLLPLDHTGMARLLEYTHRLSGDQEKISTRFGEIIDLKGREGGDSTYETVSSYNTS
jgi:predicted ATP-dependent protease